MTDTVLVHPSRGQKDGRDNLLRSLARTVSFREERFGLSDLDRAALLARHPSGAARFWGTYDHNRSKILRVQEGDVVVFTGQRRAWAVGTVGYRFESQAFASELWNVHPEKGAYRHVYSLATFEEVEIPYPVLNEPLGNKPNNHFQQMNVYSGERGRALIEQLRLDLAGSAAASYAEADDLLARTLAGDAQVDLLAIEESRSPIVPVVAMASERMVRRGEAALVAAYAATLVGVQFGRSRTPAGVTDLEVRHESGSELIEAKSATTTECIRAVLAQILHYASASRPAPTRVSGLFPERPAPVHVALLHRYGIDVLYRSGHSQFRREAAPEAARTRLTAFWA